MKINLSPIRSDKTLTLSKEGDVLTINGEEFDFTLIPDGGLLPQGAITSEDLFIVSNVERIDGEIVLTVLLPHGANASEAQRFPEPIVVTEDGPIVFPWNMPVENEAQIEEIV